MDQHDTIRTEFSRTAEAFNKRTGGRYQALGVPAFARARDGERVLEVGAGGAAFLSLFEPTAALAVALDLTPAMLAVARRDHEGVRCVVGDGAALPFADATFDVTASALAFHHMDDPLPVLREMARTSRDRVLIVDQCSSEDVAETAAMTELEKVRDPTHAASRPPSAYRALAAGAGLRVVDERIVDDVQRLSSWMWPDEFPAERIEAVRAFLRDRGAEIGMDARAEGGDWAFTRRRLMLLAEVA